MNPHNGLRVHAYKDSFNKRSTDRELLFVAKYLLQLSLLDDIRGDGTTLDHKNFRSYPGLLPPGVLDPTKLNRNP